MNPLRIAKSIDSAIQYIGEGYNFNLNITHIKNIKRFIETNFNKTENFKHGCILNTEARISLTHFSHELGQILAYSVYQRFQIYFVDLNKQYFLRFKKR